MLGTLWAMSLGAEQCSTASLLSYCSFCGESQHRVRKLFRAPSAAAICDECVRLSADMLREDRMATPALPVSPPPLPDE